MSTAEKPFVLLVDDNEATRTLISAVLSRDFAVDVVSDGTEAIERLRTKRYAAILLDLRMPPPDGFAVLQFLQDHDPLRLGAVLVVTAALSAAEVARAKAFGICGIVSKPFEVETLLEAVKQCASAGGDSPIGNVLASSGTMIFLLADLLKQRLL